MPTYQYLCTDCGNGLEVQQSFSENSLTVCPSCTGKLRKIFNAVGVVFKGSGFYRNDSREASKSTVSTESSSGSSGDKSGSSDGGSSSDSKPSSETKSSGSDTSSKKTDSKPTASTPA